MREVVEDPPWSVVLEQLEQDPLTRLIGGQDGIIARWQARRFVSDKAIEHQLKSGRWRRVHRAVYDAHGGPLTLRQRQWIAALAVTPDPPRDGGWPVRLAGVSALQVHGLRGVTTDNVHVVVAGGRRLLGPAGVTVHRVTTLTDEDLHPIARPPATSAGRAVVDASAWSRSDDEARLIIAASFQQRLVTAPEILAVLDRMPTVPRRHLIVITTRDASDGSHSLGELGLVAICRADRLPLPTRQLAFRDSNGRTRYLDAVFDRWRVAVEIDGAHHADVRQFWDDSERQNDIVLARWAILRFPAHVVRTQPHTVAAKLRGALLNAGWRPEVT